MISVSAVIDDAAARTSEKPALILAHHHPGRLRLRSDALWVPADGGEDDDSTNNDQSQRVCSDLEAVEGVTKVTLNTRSGSVLVEYEPGIVDPNVLIEVLARSADLALPMSAEELMRTRSGASGVTIKTAAKVNSLTEGLTGGRADLRSAIPITLTGLAVISFAMLPGRLPRWDNCVYWAFAVFQALHSADIARSRAAAAPATNDAPAGGERSSTTPPTTS